MLAQKSTPIETMLVLDVEHDELVKRLLKRAEVSGRSDDMDPSVIENRICVYREKTEPVARYYNDKGRYDQIEGMGEIADIFARLCKVVDKYV